MNTVIETKNAPAAVGPYSQAIKAGNTLYMAGQIPLDAVTGELVNTDVTAEIRQILKNMKAVLEAAGASFENVVKVTVFITDIDYFADVNTIYAEAFSKNPPARSCVVVKALPKGARVELEAIAVL